MNDNEWISPNRALEITRHLPRNREALARRIARGEIELWCTSVTSWIDGTSAEYLRDLLEYNKAYWRYLEGMNRPGRVGTATVPEPTKPMPPLEAHKGGARRVPVEQMEGVNYNAPDFWDHAELVLRNKAATDPAAQVIFAGCRLRRADVEAQLGIMGRRTETVVSDPLGDGMMVPGDQCDLDGNTVPPSISTDAGATKRGVLPANAGAADRKYEEYAHQAACLVRDRKSLAAAIRQLNPIAPPAAPENVRTGVRRTFKLMYDKHGKPLRS